jgi:predicted DsbA family dithiol-disulfide isomerase
VRELTGTDAGVDVIWRAFELRPDPVPTRDPKGEYLRNVWQSSVYPLAERLGITMKQPPVQPRTRLAHEAARWARTQGRFDLYHESIFKALFERGEDIGNLDVLAALAAGCGLDGAAMRTSIDRREFEPDVLGDERAAAELGINAVPAFVANRRAALSGVQPVNHLRQLLAHARSSSG